MKKNMKLLILSVSAGAGHVRAADALKKTAEKLYPGINAVHLDLMDYVPSLFRKIYADSYVKVINHNPELWGFLYNRTDKEEKKNSLYGKFRRKVQELNTVKFSRKLDELDCDRIICTHFLPAELISKMISRGTVCADCHVAVTDFDIHSLWIHSHMKSYFAASAEVAWRMREKGVPGDDIYVTGIPIAPVFGSKLSREACARELGISPEKTTVLLMSGGLGVGGVGQIAERLVSMEGDFQILALAGKNKELLDALRKMSEMHKGKIFPTGFTTTIERHMAASDIAVTKPGGLTSSECLAMGMPMIVISPIPGQEERNADYLLENGAALKAHDAAVLEFKLRGLFETPSKMCEMRNAALKLGCPHAAAEILKIVLES